MSSLYTWVLLLGVLAVFFLAYRSAKYRSRSQHLPPGPPADPLIGNLRVFTTGRNQEEVFAQLGRQYGDVIHLRVLGKDIVVLNSEQAAKDLLEKRGANYSNRQAFYLFSQVGWKDMFSILAHDSDQFIRQRRILQQPLTNQRITEYKEIHEEEVTDLIKKLLDRPEEFVEHLHLMTASVVSSITYGHRITSEDDPYWKIVEHFTSVLKQSDRMLLYDLVPPLRYLPEWTRGWIVPSMKDSRRVVHNMMQFPLNDVEEQLAKGTASSSIVSRHLEALKLAGDSEQHNQEEYTAVRGASYVLLTTGSESTWLTLVIFIACMVIHPEVQKKAQHEIDSVVGKDRLPDFSDRESLPYVHAVMQEVMRRYPVAPLGVAHSCAADDEYQGMFIPKGSNVIANAWSMAMDETVFHDPLAFNPERFLPKPEGLGEVLSSNIPFGFGRRKCLGSTLAEATIWLAIVRILAVFDITKAKDDAGREIDIDLKLMATGLTSYPKPFKCDIHPRSWQAKSLAQNM